VPLAMSVISFQFCFCPNARNIGSPGSSLGENYEITGERGTGVGTGLADPAVAGPII